MNVDQSGQTDSNSEVSANESVGNNNSNNNKVNLSMYGENETSYESWSCLRKVLGIRKNQKFRKSISQ